MVSIDERLELIKRNTIEIITEEELIDLLKTKSNLSVYIGRATTGPLHLGHILALSKLLDFQKAGFRTKILLADIHAAMDDLKAKWDDLDKRTEYTRACIENSFDWRNKPEFVRGSDYQLEKEYSMDILKLSTISTVDRAMRAASEVTRMKNPKVSELIYPIMQALDEEYLGVDVQLGGLDQRHIFAYARDYLPEIGYKKRVEVMTPLVASLQGPGTKMSSSVKSSNIKVYDSEESIKRKINSAYCPEGIVDGNLLLQIARFLVFPSQDKITIERPQKFGGDMTFGSYKELEEEFAKKTLHPADLKAYISSYLIKRLEKVRKFFENKQDILKDLGPEFLPD